MYVCIMYVWCMYIYIYVCVCVCVWLYVCLSRSKKAKHTAFFQTKSIAKSYPPEGFRFLCILEFEASTERKR